MKNRGLSPTAGKRIFNQQNTDESAAAWPAECAASLSLTARNRRREKRYCRYRGYCRYSGVGPHARGAALATSSNRTIAKVYPKKSLALSVCIFYGKKAAKRV